MEAYENKKHMIQDSCEFLISFLILAENPRHSECE